MKNTDIITLVGGGFLAITYHSVATEHAYKVYKARKAVARAIAQLAENERELQAVCGIVDEKQFDKELAELRAKGESKELRAKEKQLQSFLDLRRELYEDVSLATESFRTIPYGEWRKLQDENKAVIINGAPTDILSGDVEILLEGVLWKAPEEKEEEK